MKPAVIFLVCCFFALTHINAQKGNKEVGLDAQLSCLDSANSEANSMIWKFWKPGIKDTSYLVGTIHIPQRRVVYSVDTVYNILSNVDELCVELVMKPSSMAEQAKNFIAQTKDQRLSSKLSEIEYALYLETVGPRLGPMADALKMFNLMGGTSALLMAMLPQDTTKSIDVLLQDAAREAGKNVSALESVAEQIDALKEISEDTLKNEIVRIISDKEGFNEELNEMVEAYVKGDLRLLGELVMSNDLDPAAKTELLDKRNLRMYNRLKYRFDKSSLMIAVGAAHLVGDTGLICQLANDGFVVVPVQQKKK